MGRGWPAVVTGAAVPPWLARLGSRRAAGDRHNRRPCFLHVDTI